MYNAFPLFLITKVGQPRETLSMFLTAYHPVLTLMFHIVPLCMFSSLRVKRFRVSRPPANDRGIR